MGMTLELRKDAICAAIDSFKQSDSDLMYTCEESEQLYGIGYHRVYESCKADPFLSKFSVDWAACLNAHYPWVDILASNICVVKSHDNDFIACFCSMKKGTLHSRGFCITKFECLLYGRRGVENPRINSLEISQNCFNDIQYFLEAN